MIGERISSKYKDMARLLKRNEKLVSMAKNIMTDLVSHLQPVMTVLKKTLVKQASTLMTMNQYSGQPLYNWFENINKAFDSDKFFYYLGTVIWQYKSKQMLAVF